MIFFSHLLEILRFTIVEKVNEVKYELWNPHEKDIGESQQKCPAPNVTTQQVKEKKIIFPELNHKST